MKKVKTDKGTFIFVEVPGTLSLDEYLNLHTTIFKLEHFEVISTTKDITEDQAATIVKKGGLKTFKDYTYVDQDLDEVGLFNALLQFKIKTAKESLDTLMLSESLDLNKNYLIINDDGQRYTYRKYLFESLEEVRDRKLKLLI